MSRFDCWLSPINRDGEVKIPVNTFTGPASPPPLPLLPQADRIEPQVIEGVYGDNDVDDDWLMDG